MGLIRANPVVKQRGEGEKIAHISETFLHLRQSISAAQGARWKVVARRCPSSSYIRSCLRFALPKFSTLSEALLLPSSQSCSLSPDRAPESSSEDGSNPIESSSISNVSFAFSFPFFNPSERPMLFEEFSLIDDSGSLFLLLCDSRRRSPEGLRGLSPFAWFFHPFISRRTS